MPNPISTRPVQTPPVATPPPSSANPHGAGEAASVLGPLAVGIAGFAFGVAVHHDVEEQRAQFRALANEAGIR